MKLPRRRFLHLAAGAAGSFAHRTGGDLSIAAGARDRAVRARRHDRHRRATDGTVAFRAPWPAIRHREPARRVHHDRDRGGRACARGWLCALAGHHVERDQYDALRKQAQLQFPPRHRADRRHLPSYIRPTGTRVANGSPPPGVTSQRLGAQKCINAACDYGFLGPRRPSRPWQLWGLHTRSAEVGPIPAAPRRERRGVASHSAGVAATAFCPVGSAADKIVGERLRPKRKTAMIV